MNFKTTSSSVLLLLALSCWAPSGTQAQEGSAPADSTATTTAETGEAAPANTSGFRFRSQAAVRDEREGQFYVAAFGGISFGGNTEDPELNLTAPTGGLSGTQELVMDGDGNQGVAGIKVGYETSGYAPSGVDFLVIRPALEIEFTYAPQSLSGTSNFLTAAAANAGAATYQQDIDIFTIMLNPIARFQLFDRYTPYVGGGFGAALLDADAPSTTLAGANVLGTGTDEEIALALQALVGFEVDIMHGFSVFTEYKFHYMRDISFAYSNTTLGNNAKFDYTDLTRHMFTGGVKYKF